MIQIDNDSFMFTFVKKNINNERISRTNCYRI